MLHDIVETQARAQPHGTALVFGPSSLTFGELAARTRRVAAMVATRSAPGDRVAVVGENHPAWVECYYGVPRAGRLLTFLNHRSAPAELARVVDRCSPALVIGTDDTLGALSPRLTSSPALLDLDGYEAALDDTPPTAAGAAAEPTATDDGRTAWLIHTSGTTGTAKAAMLTHASLRAAVDVTAAARPVAPDDVYLFPFPLCHVAGYNLLNHHVHGRPVILLPRFSPEGVVEAAAAARATTTSLAATMLAALLDHVDEQPSARPRLASLRSVAYGAAPMPETLLRRAHEELGVDLAQGYGMTELSGNAVFLDPAAHRQGLAGARHLLRAAGRPGPGVTVRVVDDDGRDVATGTPGEIVVRGPQVTPGYWEDPSATEEAFRHGWFHTGDVGRWDDDGWLYVVDRKKDVIVTGGENVSSRAVEDVLDAHPAIRAVAVVGVPDERWGENVCAVVVPHPGAAVTAGELAAVVRNELGGFSRPRHVVFVESLPTNAAGKVVKQELRRWLADHPEELRERT